MTTLKNLLIKNLLSHVRRSKFVGPIFSLFLGTGISQTIILLASLFLTRLFTPEDFGQFYLFLVSATLFAIIQTGSLEKAIIVSKNITESNQIFILTLLLILLSNLILLLLFPFINLGLLSLLGKDIPISLFLCFLFYASAFGFLKLLQSYCNRIRKFKVIASANIIKATFMSFAQLGFGYNGFGYKGLIYGGLVGLTISIIFISLSNLSEFKSLRQVLFMKKYAHLVKEKLSFFVYETPVSIINELSIQLPLFVFKASFGQAYAGHYSLPQRVLGQPMQLIGRSVAEVFFRFTADMEHTKTSQKNIAFKTFKSLFLLGLLPFTIITLFGPSIFKFVFGDAWYESGMVASALAPWMLFVFSGSPISSIFITKGKLKNSLFLNLVLLISRISALVIGSLLFNNFLISVILFGSVSFIYWFFLTVYSLHLSGVETQKAISFIIKWMLIPTLLFLITKAL